MEVKGKFYFLKNLRWISLTPVKRKWIHQHPPLLEFLEDMLQLPFLFLSSFLPLTVRYICQHYNYTTELARKSYCFHWYVHIWQVGFHNPPLLTFMLKSLQLLCMRDLRKQFHHKKEVYTSIFYFSIKLVLPVGNNTQPCHWIVSLNFNGLVVCSNA